MTLTEAKYVFENIDITNEVLAKKKHRELVKKYHTDLSNGDIEKIKEINVAYELIKQYQEKLKFERNSKQDKEKIIKKFNFELSRLKEDLKNIKFDLKANSRILKELKEDYLYFKSEITKYQNKLNRNPFYTLFEDKTDKEKIKNFTFLILGVELLIIFLITFICTKCFLLSFFEIFLFNFLALSLFLFNFAERRYNINVTKKYIKYCYQKKNEIAKEIDETVDLIFSLKEKEEKISIRIKTVSENLKQFTA